jgi:hypothetical protein
MKKEEASGFLKEVLSECNLAANSFNLIEPDIKDTLSTGYKVQVKAVMQTEFRLKLKQITKKHDLAIAEEENQIIIYKPKTNHKIV